MSSADQSSSARIGAMGSFQFNSPSTLRHAIIGRAMIVVGVVAFSLLAVARYMSGEGATLGDMLWAGVSCSVVTVAVALVLNVMLMRVTAPLEELARCTKRIAEGDMGQQVPCLDRNDEIGAMAAAVQTFKEALVERTQLRGEVDRADTSAAARQKRVDAMIQDFRTTVSAALRKVSGGTEQMQSAADRLSSLSADSAARARAAANEIGRAHV